MLWLFNLIGTRVGVNAAWRLFAVGLPLLALAAGLAGGAWGAWAGPRCWWIWRA